MSRLTNGWIKLDRRLLNWEWFDSPKTLSVWVYLLLNANIEPTTYKGVPIDRGSCACTLREIASKTGLSIKEVRTALAHLRAYEVAIQTRRDFSIISILSYDEYQGKGTPKGTQKGNPSNIYKNTKNGSSEYNASHTRPPKKKYDGDDRYIPVIEWD